MINDEGSFIGRFGHKQKWKIKLSCETRGEFDLKGTTITIPSDSVSASITYPTATGVANSTTEEIFLHELLHAGAGADDPDKKPGHNLGTVVFSSRRILDLLGEPRPPRFAYSDTPAGQKEEVIRAAELEKEFLDYEFELWGKRSVAKVVEAGEARPAG